MNLRRSPTLDLAAAVEQARSSNQAAFSLSTPTFTERAADLDLRSVSSLLSPPAGLAELRTRVRDTLLGKWDLPDHEVLITAGAKAAILSALRTHCAAGDRILVIGPHWPSYIDSARLLYLEPVGFEPRFEDDFAVDARALAAAMAESGARAIVLSNPNNPTGRVHRGPELTEIAEVAREFRALLLIDESFSGVVFDQARWNESLCPPYERLVVVNSFSKTYHLQGLRIGICAAHSSFFEAIVSAHQTALSAASSVSQTAVLALLKSGGRPPDYSRQRESALAFVRAEGWPCYPAEGSFYLFPRVEDMDALERAGASGNVFMLRGEAFGRSYGDHVRLCFGKPLEELERIFAVLRGSRTGGIRRP